ncbi:MAG: hypothetical protein WAK57_19000 [Desulfobacterales bacterium]
MQAATSHQLAKIPSPVSLPIGSQSSPAKLILKLFQYVIVISGLSYLAQELPEKEG